MVIPYIKYICHFHFTLIHGANYAFIYHLCGEPVFAVNFIKRKIKYNEINTDLTRGDYAVMKAMS